MLTLDQYFIIFKKAHHASWNFPDVQEMFVAKTPESFIEIALKAEFLRFCKHK